MSKKLTDKDFVTKMSGTNSIFGNFGGQVGQITLDNFRNALNANDEQVLNNLAFYIDVNKASSLGSTSVDVGGNMNMRSLWENSAISILMDENGNYCELNRNDCRYTAEGDYLLNSDGTIVSEFSHGDFMKIIPVTYGRIQQVTVGATTVLRLWLSLVPLPGGYTIPQLVVGKFKASIVSDRMRSLPGMVPANSYTVYGFWDKAQLRSKNHGLANLDFRNYLLFHMMSKYAYRDCQNCKGTDGTLIWGVGLDGTESTGSDKFVCQRYIKTGHTLSLGDNDGKMAVTDADGTTVHGVSVAGFENPWGQYWEMIGGLCSVGTDVYHWRSNVMPTGSPTAASFEHIDHVVLQRYTSGGVTQMNMIASEQGQGCYMIQKASADGIYYGDNYWYGASGQLWLFGGYSDAGARCGLACAYSHGAWTYSDADSSARLAYYGSINKVSSTQFKALAS